MSFTHVRQWADTELRVALFGALTWTRPWQYMYGTAVVTPRMTSWLGDATYTYSKIVNPPAPWHPIVATMRDRLQAEFGLTFNSCLANYYVDGKDSIAWHSDDEPELGHNPTIASVSLGAYRKFVVRHKETRAKQEYLLGQGDLLIMGGNSQSDYEHSIPKTKALVGPRLNLTFRKIT